MAHVGQEVRRLREERELNQAQLAVLIGTGPAAISRIENGRQSPNSTTLEKLAKALEVEISDLFPKKAQAPLQLELEEQAGQRSHEANEREQYAAERRYLVPLLEFCTSQLTELSKGHKPFFASLSKDLPPSRSFAVLQRVDEFMYTCD